MIWFLAIPAVLLIGLLVVDYQISAPGHNGHELEHFNGTKFQNPDEIRGRGLFDMIKWALTGDRGEWRQINKQEVTFGNPTQYTSSQHEISITFVNHATFLVQMGRMNILTDPIWSDRASPYSWVGPKRVRPPGIAFDNLPAIDMVLISHNHYDHLDLPTAKRLKAEHNPLFITPLGVGQFLNHHGIHQTVDLNWWENYMHGESNRTNIVSVPAQHFSGRGVFDRDQTLWCGYVLQTETGTIYFAGDTAYGNFFPNIGDAFDIDIALIPIGSYKPRWFMESIHADPDEAVQIHRDVGSSQSIGMHFGTFPLGDDGMDEPARDLAAAMNKADIPDSEFVVLDEGRPFIYHTQNQKISIPAE